MKYLLTTLLFSLVISCGDDSDSKDENLPTFKDLSYVGRDTADLETSDTSLSGSGKIGLEQPLGGEVLSNSKIIISFTLEDKGSITLHSYADSNLENGVDIVFTREGDELETKFVVGGVEKVLSFHHDEDEHEEDEDGHDHEGEEHHEGLEIDASGTITLKIDVHNSEDPAHIVFWEADADVAVSNENLIFNSADTEEGDNQPPGQGSGTYLGITLNKATLLNLAIDEATSEDDIGEAHDHDHD